MCVCVCVCVYSRVVIFLIERYNPRGGGGHSGTEGAAPAVRISREKGSFFKTSACPRPGSAIL